MAGAVGYLAWLGASSSWQYYLSVDEAVADAAHLAGKRLRVSGRVTPGSLTVADDRRQATMKLAGERHTLHVACRCLLPDNLAEGIEVVVEGTMQSDGIHGDRVITRCASKYQVKDGAATGNGLPPNPPT